MKEFVEVEPSQLVWSKQTSSDIKILKFRINENITRVQYKVLTNCKSRIRVFPQKGDWRNATDGQAPSNEMEIQVKLVYFPDLMTEKNVGRDALLIKCVVFGFDDEELESVNLKVSCKYQLDNAEGTVEKIEEVNNVESTETKGEEVTTNMSYKVAAWIGDRENQFSDGFLELVHSLSENAWQLLCRNASAKKEDQLSEEQLYKLLTLRNEFGTVHWKTLQGIVKILKEETKENPHGKSSSSSQTKQNKQRDTRGDSMEVAKSTPIGVPKRVIKNDEGSSNTLLQNAARTPLIATSNSHQVQQFQGRRRAETDIKKRSKDGNTRLRSVTDRHGRYHSQPSTFQLMSEPRHRPWSGNGMELSKVLEDVEKYRREHTDARNPLLNASSSIARNQRRRTIEAKEQLSIETNNLSSNSTRSYDGKISSPSTKMSPQSSPRSSPRQLVLERNALDKLLQKHNAVLINKNVLLQTQLDLAKHSINTLRRENIKLQHMLQQLIRDKND
eukprot:g2029.t1